MQPKLLDSTLIQDFISSHPTAPAVTIFIPTHRAATSPNMTEDQIRTKNLFHKAIEILNNRDDGAELALTLRERLAALETDKAFWNQQTAGLLVLARPGSFEMFQLPIDTEEYVAVADYFHIAPLLGVLDDMREFYVLAVAQHEPALFRGDIYGLTAINADMPVSIEAGLRLDEPNIKSEQQRSSGGETGGFNGRGGAKSPLEEDRLRFWRLVDQRLSEHTDKKLPLILAGVESDTSEYRRITRYPHVLKATVSGSRSASSGRGLFDAAWNIIRTEVLDTAHDEIVAEYQRAQGQAPNQAAHDFATMSDAADNGRVDKLLLADIRYTTDTVQDNMKPVPVLSFPPQELAQAVQDIALAVINASGRIVNIAADHMPVPGAFALATLRY